VLWRVPLPRLAAAEYAVSMPQDVDRWSFVWAAMIGNAAPLRFLLL